MDFGVERLEIVLNERGIRTPLRDVSLVGFKSVASGSTLVACNGTDAGADIVVHLDSEQRDQDTSGSGGGIRFGMKPTHVFVAARCGKQYGPTYHRHGERIPLDALTEDRLHSAIAKQRFAAKGIGRSIEDWVLSAHRRDRDVGGLFNAYEAAAHYAIFTGALRTGLAEAGQETPLGKGQTTCDLTIPYVRGGRVWTEVKMWWWLDSAYSEGVYRMQPKTRSMPAADWQRLARVGEGGWDRRVLVLFRVWDSDAGLAQAERWLSALRSLMDDAPRAPHQFQLDSAEYQSPRHTRSGDVLVWVNRELSTIPVAGP